MGSIIGREQEWAMEKHEKRNPGNEQEGKEQSMHLGW